MLKCCVSVRVVFPVPLGVCYFNCLVMVSMIYEL